MDAMDAKVDIISRQLPKTGQSQEYQSGDDGTYEAGWWRGLLLADNKERFILKYLENEFVAIDRATGLVWAAFGNRAGCGDGQVFYWAAAITYAEELDFAGFDDWRLPNILELTSIVDFGKYNPAIYDPPFSNTENLPYWTATSYENFTSIAWQVNFLSGISATALKAGSENFIRCVRGGL